MLCRSALTVAPTTQRLAARRLAFLVLLTSLAVAPAWAGGGIPWRENFKAAKEEAVKTGKPLLIEYNSKGCGWCREMEKKTHPDPAVIATLRRHVVPVRVTGDPGGIKKAHNIKGTPRTLILDAETMTLVGNIRGFKMPATYVSMVNASRSRLALFREIARSICPAR